MIGTNQFTTDNDVDGYDEISTDDYIYWRIRVTIPTNIGNTTYTNSAMTWDAGTYA